MNAREILATAPAVRISKPTRSLSATWKLADAPGGGALEAVLNVVAFKRPRGSVLVATLNTQVTTADACGSTSTFDPMQACTVMTVQRPRYSEKLLRETLEMALKTIREDPTAPRVQHLNPSRERATALRYFEAGEVVAA